MLDLAAIKARAEAATPGPWQAIGGVISDGTRGIEGRVRNAEFCAHARTDVPGLLAVVERLQRVEDAARKIAEHPGYHPNHLGDCIGPLSDLSCQCGLTDLRYAVRALDELPVVFQ